VSTETTVIRRVDVHAVRLHHAGGPFRMSGGRVSTDQDATVVRVETGDGLVGWGEQCVFTPSFLPGYGPATRAVLGLLAPAVLGADPRQVDVVYARMDAAIKGYAYAKSALDIACWDVLGRSVGLRISDLLGGTHQEELSLYAGVGIASPDEVRQRCAELLAAGYRQVQLKVGTDWRADVERIEACVDALGNDVDRVMLDANGYWPLADAVRVVSAVAGLDVFVEQPCASIEECAQVRRSAGRPLILDESLTGIGELVRAREAGAADAVRLKISRLGGITPARRVRDLAVAFGLPITVEDSGGGDIVTAASMHMNCSLPPQFLLSGYLPSSMVVERFATGTPTAANGRAQLPSRPGLGIEIDEAALGKPVLRVE
jgi:L-alanine-DL-glutamate epimerase-like enolase superfamily enzyme